MELLIAWAVIGAVVYWLAVPARARSAYLLLISLGFIVVMISRQVGPAKSVLFALYFLLNTVVVYVAAGRMRRWPERKQTVIRIVLLWLIGSLAFFKYTDLVLAQFGLEGLSQASRGVLPDIVLPLGISYIVFRMIHYSVEVYRGKAPPSGFADFAAYVLFFPTFRAGPVERFPAFQAQTAAARPLDLADVNQGVLRIVCGVVKKVVADGVISPWVAPILAAPGDHSGALVLLATWGLAWQVYLDFSGYTDLALGTSRLFGYTVMENFHWPFSQKNIAMFWRNWHISVYTFIRDYFFFPFFSRKPSLFKTCLGILCTMMVFMLWHEGSWPWLALGVYHGMGLVVWTLFQEWKRTSKRLRQFVSRPEFDPIWIFLTFNFVAVGFLFFDNSLTGVGAVLTRILLHWNG